MELVVVGAGVVGTATGKGFLRHGHAVQFVDVDPHRIDTLRQAGFAASDHVDLTGPEKVVLLSVPTPFDGARYELDAVRASAAAVGSQIAAADAPPIIVLRSTVPPGTCDQILVPVLARTSNLVAGEDFSVASNPEFLRAACALEDVLHPWMTVIGSRSKRTRERLASLYAPFGGELVTFADTATAELVKAANNVYNATKISFWNEMSRLADRIGVDATSVARTVARSAEGSWNVDYGIDGGRPYGGMCLPKDTKGFLAFAAELGIDMPVLAATVRVNDQMRATADPSRVRTAEHDSDIVDLTEHETSSSNAMGDKGGSSVPAGGADTPPGPRPRFR